MFAPRLDHCTELTFEEQSIEVPSKTMVQYVKDKTTVVKKDKGQLEGLPMGCWLGGGET